MFLLYMLDGGESEVTGSAAVCAGVLVLAASEICGILFSVRVEVAAPLSVVMGTGFLSDISFATLLQIALLISGRRVVSIVIGTSAILPSTLMWVKGSDTSVYVLLYMLDGGEIEVIGSAAVCAADCAADLVYYAAEGERLWDL